MNALHSAVVTSDTNSTASATQASVVPTAETDSMIDTENDTGTDDELSKEARLEMRRILAQYTEVAQQVSLPLDNGIDNDSDNGNGNDNDSGSGCDSNDPATRRISKCSGFSNKQVRPFKLP
jgi:hypothetical protein